jgi:hypothetical protein
VPWDLTPEQRKLLNLHGRQLVQPRTPDTKIESGRVGGVQVGDLILLAALEDLGDQGNVVARDVASMLRDRLSIGPRSTFSIGRTAHGIPRESTPPG